MKWKNTALYVAVTAIYSALLIVGKLALNVVPNVEVVTLFVAVCAYVWGLGVAIPAVLVFVTLQMAMFSFGMWVAEYYVHWTVVAVVFGVLGKAQIKHKTIVCVVCASLLTVLFGVFTTAVDTLIGYTAGSFKVVWADYFVRFGIMYAQGIAFFAIHVVSNAVIFSVAFNPLTRVNEKIVDKLQLRN